MTDLTEFLLARIAEDEDAARSASVTGSALSGKVWTGERWAEAVWGPDRVLAECEAERRIVELHRLIDGIDAWDEPVRGCGNCCACGREGEFLIEGPCLTVRLLALPYADHPDYRPEWRQ